jgi:16S rRNA (guanine1207-N2)-methyltransferase
MNHYYRNDDNLKSQKRVLDLYINDNKLSFVSDVGVFSNTQIDYGSYTFLKTILKENSVDTLLDVGCGYGVLGITLKYFDKCDYVDMVDINERAVLLTKENIEYYKFSNSNCFVSNGFESINRKYDRIVINPPIRAGKEVIYKMFDDSVNHLNENGALYIVIKKSLGAPSAMKKLSTIYKNVEIIKKDKGYYIIKSFN